MSRREDSIIKRPTKRILILILTAICLIGQLAVPGLVCAQAYVSDAQSDLEMGFAFDSTRSAVLFARQEQEARSIRLGNESEPCYDPRPSAWVCPNPAPLSGRDEPPARRIRRIMPPHSIHGPPPPSA